MDDASVNRDGLYSLYTNIKISFGYIIRQIIAASLLRNSVLWSHFYHQKLRLSCDAPLMFPL